MSNSPKVEHKTKAIMFTDIRGYTKAMSKGQQKVLEIFLRNFFYKNMIVKYGSKHLKEVALIIITKQFFLEDNIR